MNKKGFTLVELLAVIALLAILMGIAIPNIISTINNNKRDVFLMDAKRMIAKAEYLISENKEDRNKLRNEENSYVVYVLDENDLNENNEFEIDADGGYFGGEYDEEKETKGLSFVKVTFSRADNSYRYCICVLGSKRNISLNGNCDSIDNCLYSNDLSDIEVVKDN